MRNKLLMAAIILAGAIASSSAEAVCPTFHTLSNGTTADASAVMDNFNYILNCPGFTGPVGIGTATPGAVLQIIDTNGGFFFETAGSSYNRLKSTTTSAGVGRDFLINVQDAGTQPNLFLRASDGYVGVGTSAPSARLHVMDINGGLFIEGSGSSYNRIKSTTTTPSVGRDLMFNAQDAGTQPNLYLKSNGNVGINTSSPGQKLDVAGTIRQSNCTTAGTLSTNTSGDIICTSDARLKNIRGPFAGGLDAIMRLTPQRFTYKPTKTDPVETFVHAGFIAQNVKNAIPEAVAKQHSGYYSLDTTAVLAAAVNAIKELKSLNDKQAREISQLKARDTALLEKLDRQASQLTELRAGLDHPRQAIASALTVQH